MNCNFIFIFKGRIVGASAPGNKLQIFSESDRSQFNITYLLSLASITPLNLSLSCEILFCLSLDDVEFAIRLPEKLIIL